MFEIKRASAIPDQPVCGGGPHQRYGFDRMTVGDVFLVPADHPGAVRACLTSPTNSTSRVAAAARSFGRYHGWRFRCTKQLDGSIRIERIK